MSVATYLALHLYLNKKKSLDKLEGMLSFWKKIENHLLRAYATDDTIVETEM